MKEESYMSSDSQGNDVSFSWKKVSLTREEEELLRNLPLPPCMVEAGGSRKFNGAGAFKPCFYRKASTKKQGLLWWMRDDNSFLAAYKALTKEDDRKSNLRKIFMSISSRKRSSDINLVSFSHTQVTSEKKSDDVCKLHRPVSLTREDEELLDTLPLPPCMVAAGCSPKVSAGVHQDIQNLPVPLCVSQSPYDRRSTKKGLWWKHQEDDPFLAAYKALTKEDDRNSNLRKIFMSISSRKRSSDINLVSFSHTQVTSEKKSDDVCKLHRPVSLTREDEELLDTLPLPPCMAAAGCSPKVNAGVHQDIRNLPVPLCVSQSPYNRRSTKKGLRWKHQEDDPFLAAYKALTKEDDRKSNLRKIFMSSFSGKRSIFN